MSRIVQCKGCETRLEVPDGSEGRKFRCSTCKEIIVIPPLEEETPAEPVSEAAESPPEEEGAPSRPGRRPTVGRTRRFREKTRRRSRKDRGGEGEKAPPPKGFPVLLLGLGGVGLVLVVLAVAAVLFLLPGGDDGEAHTEEEVEGSAEASPSSTDGKKAVPGPGAYRRRVLEAKTAEDWYAAGIAAREAGRPANARLHFLKAVRLDADLAKAWEALGYRRFTIPQEYRHLLESPGVLKALRSLDGRWLDPLKFEEIQDAVPAYLEAAVKEFEAYGKGANFAEIEEVRNRIHNSTGFKERIWGDRPALPYFLFDERGKKGGRLLSKEDSEFLVNKKLNMLQKVFRFTEERWMKPLGFTWDKGRPLVAIIFQNRESFSDFNRSIGTFLPAGAIAYFNRGTKFIYMYDARSIGTDGQDHQDGILFHEATHQIVDAYLASGSGMARVGYWFNEGIAEYVGSVNRFYGEGDEVDWVFGAENKGRITEFWRARRPDLSQRMREMGITFPYAFTLKEVLTACRNRWATMQVLRKKIKAEAWAAFESGGAAGSLIYAQSYFILYFGYACGKPEYKEAMDRYLDMEFKGKGSRKAFMDAFGLQNDADFARLEAEILAFHDSLVPDDLKRKR